MDSQTAHCPFCGASIDPMEFPFLCAACGREDDKFSVLLNCEFCGFSPHFVRCPDCKSEFPSMLLLGNYVDGEGDPLPPERKKEYQDKHSFVFGQLNVQVSGSVEGEVLNRFGDVALQHVAQTSFGFPFDIPLAVIHTAHISDDGRRWLHVWAFQGTDEDLAQSKPFGQFTVVYPGYTEQGAEDGSEGCCIVKEVFFVPLQLVGKEVDAVRRYRVIDFLRRDEVLISPDIQDRPGYPFTLERARRFFDKFQSESFAFDGEVKSIIIFDGKENLPRHSFATGLLYPHTLDQLKRLGTVKQPVGEIHFECGGTLSAPRIGVSRLRLQQDKDKP